MNFVLSFLQTITPQTAATWVGDILTVASQIGLKTTSWRSGAISKTLLTVVSYGFQQLDASVSLHAQAGFIDYAATGTVTYVDATGTVIVEPVTPEGGPGALDVLCDSVYDVQRILESSAGGQEAFVNTSGSTYGPFVAGGLHISSPYSSATYSSTASVTIPPSPLAGTSIASLDSYFGEIQVTTSSNHGLSTGAVVAVLGVNGVPALAGVTAWRATVLSPTTFKLDGSVMSGSYTSGGTVRVPTVATVNADVSGTTGNSVDSSGLTNANVVTQMVTSLIGVSCSNLDPFFGTDTELNLALAARARLKLQSLSTGGPKGAYAFFALSANQFGLKLSPPVKLGSAITRVAVDRDSGNGTVYVFAANQAGPISDADVATADAVIQAYATPEAVTAFVVSALGHPTTVSATVWLPAAYANNDTKAAFQAAVQAYFKSLPIGGVSDPRGSYQHIVPREAIAGAIYDAAEDRHIPIQNTRVLIDGIDDDLQLVFSTSFLEAEVAILSPAVPLIDLVAV